MAFIGFLQKQQMSHSHLRIADRLMIEALRRTNNGSMAQVFIALVAWAYFVAQDEHTPAILQIGLSLIIVLQIIRYWLFTRDRANFQALLKRYRTLMGLSFGTALVWTILSGFVFQKYKLSSEQGIIFVINILSYIAGCTYSLASVPKIQKTYIVLVGSPLLVAAVFENSSFAWVCATLFFPFLFYLFAISDNHASDLAHTYETEASLRSEKEKLRLVINSVPGFVVLADRNNQWIETSASFHKFSDLQVLHEKLNEFRKSKASAHVEEVEWKDEKNENFYFISFTRLPDSADSVLMVGVPINELKAVRRQMEIHRAKAEYSSRLSTVGEMAGGIAHEVNTPLSIIVGATYQLRRILEESLSQDNEAEGLVHKIEVTAYRINSIIKSLQYFARQGDEEPFENAHVPMIAANALQLTQAKFAKYKVAFNISPIPDVSIPARPVQIGQVLLHLLNNAYDAALKSEVKKVELVFNKTNEGLKISVTDSGPGIPRENLNRIFEPFYTTKDIGQGSGLGLSVSKGIIQEHQGDLTVQSEPGHTTFEFTIPWTRKVESPETAG